MEQEIERISTEHEILDAQIKLICTRISDITEEEEFDPNDQLRDWISYNQEKEIRIKAINNAYANLTAADHFCMGRLEKNPVLSKWNTENEDNVWNDSKFEDDYGEFAYYEVQIMI